MKDVEMLIVVLCITFFLMLMPFLFAILDLKAGTRKARERGEKITSDGWRRTVNKLARYYNLLFALLGIDAIQIVAIWFIDNYYNHDYITFPFMVLIGVVGVGFIEIKSIYEKADDKMKRDTMEFAEKAQIVLEHHNDIAELIKELIEKEQKTDSK